MATAEGALHVDAEFQKVFDFVKHVFNIDKFYHDQSQLIKAFCGGKNIFLNVPAGYGKSIVFQSRPWIYDMINEQSIAFCTLIVISPLKSLMMISVTK